MKRITKQDKFNESIDYLIVTVCLFASMLGMGIVLSTLAYMFI